MRAQLALVRFINQPSLKYLAVLTKVRYGHVSSSR